MKTLPMNRLMLFGALLTSLTALDQVQLSCIAAESTKSIISAVQSFVDSNTLAGAVMLVALKDKVLNLNAVK